MSDLIRRTRRSQLEERHDRRDRAMERQHIRKLQALHHQADLEIEAIHLASVIARAKNQTITDVTIDSVIAAQVIASVAEMVVSQQPAAIHGVAQLTSAAQVALVKNMYATTTEVAL